MTPENVTNFDIFEEFFNQIQSGATMRDIIKEYGGMGIYVPSYAFTFRKADVMEAHSRGDSPKLIARDQRLSLSRVYEIIKEENMK
ncbi:hypothetical protein JZU61_01750 [bacterium]|nr:hypothetical protein [bacterium]